MEHKEHLLEIYKTEAEKYSSTRTIQWQINIAAWTVILVAIYLKSQNQLILNYYIQWFAGILYIIFHYIFIEQVQKSLDRSLKRMENIAVFVLENTAFQWNDVEKNIDTTKKKWKAFQLVITIFLVLIFLVIKKVTL